MAEIALVHVTFAYAAEAEAERAASQMVADRLAACATIHAACQSVYRCDGAVERAKEVPVTFKTMSDKADGLRSILAQLHSYKLPVIEVAAVSVDAAVGAWVAASTR